MTKPLRPMNRNLGFLLVPVLFIAAAGAWYLLDPGFRTGVQPTASPNALPQNAFEQRVRDYLIANPEVIVEAMRNLEERQRLAEQTEAQVALATYRDELFHNPKSPVGGNPQGDATLVEFFDYNCGYCRRVAPVMANAEEDDGQLRIVYKEFPILGPNSIFAAKAALAADRQNAYSRFHKALMQVTGSVDETRVIDVANDLGLNVEKLRTDMQDPEIKSEIDGNLKLAQALRINGTPGFVIGGEILRGATDLQTLKQLIAKAREGNNQ